jgi:hypothetical protein
MINKKNDHISDNLCQEIALFFKENKSLKSGELAHGRKKMSGAKKMDGRNRTIKAKRAWEIRKKQQGSGRFAHSIL